MCACACVHTCACACIRMCAHVSAYTCMCTYVYARVHTCVCSMSPRSGAEKSMGCLEEQQTDSDQLDPNSCPPPGWPWARSLTCKSQSPHSPKMQSSCAAIATGPHEGHTQEGGTRVRPGDTTASRPARRPAPGRASKAQVQPRPARGLPQGPGCSQGQDAQTFPTGQALVSGDDWGCPVARGFIQMLLNRDLNQWLWGPHPSDSGLPPLSTEPGAACGHCHIHLEKGGSPLAGCQVVCTREGDDWPARATRTGVPHLWFAVLHLGRFRNGDTQKKGGCTVVAALTFMLACSRSRAVTCDPTHGQALGRERSLGPFRPAVRGEVTSAGPHPHADSYVGVGALASPRNTFTFSQEIL